MGETSTGRTRDVYRDVTDRIVALIDLGAHQFQMPWHARGVPLVRPVNACSRRFYQGVNVVSLWAAAEVMGYSSGNWATYRQWARLGAQVRKGEKGATIVLYKETERETESPEGGEVIHKTYFLAYAARVFNADQVDGWAPPTALTPDLTKSLERAERFIAASGACIQHGGDRAYYSRSTDSIRVPNRDQFHATATSSATEGYYATLLHELTHWTGGSSRLNRDLIGRFGDEAYAIEELVAELGSAFLCADLEVTNDPRVDHAAYVASWLRVLRNDKKALFTAAGKAAEAARYLAGLHTTTNGS